MLGVTPPSHYYTDTHTLIPTLILALILALMLTLILALILTLILTLTPHSPHGYSTHPRVRGMAPRGRSIMNFGTQDTILTVRGQGG